MNKSTKAWAECASESGRFCCKPCEVKDCPNPPMRFQPNCKEHTKPLLKMGQKTVSDNAFVKAYGNETRN